MAGGKERKARAGALLDQAQSFLDGMRDQAQSLLDGMREFVNMPSSDSERTDTVVPASVRKPGGTYDLAASGASSGAAEEAPAQAPAAASGEKKKKGEARAPKRRADTAQPPSVKKGKAAAAAGDKAVDILCSKVVDMLETTMPPTWEASDATRASIERRLITAQVGEPGVDDDAAVLLVAIQVKEEEAAKALAD